MHDIVPDFCYYVRKFFNTMYRNKWIERSELINWRASSYDFF